MKKLDGFVKLANYVGLRYGDLTKSICLLFSHVMSILPYYMRLIEFLVTHNRVGVCVVFFW